MNLTLSFVFILGVINYALLAQSDPSSVEYQRLILIGQIVVVVGLVIDKLFTWRSDRKKHQEAMQAQAERLRLRKLQRRALRKIDENTAVSKDAQENAHLAKHAALNILQSKVLSTDELRKMIQDLRDEAAAAYSAANNLNEKIAAVGGLKGPVAVEVVNDATHPVPVKEPAPQRQEPQP